MRARTRILKSMMVLMIFCINAVFFLYLSRLWLVEKAIAHTLSARGLPAQMTVRQFDQSGLYITNIKIGPAIRAENMRIAWNTHGLRRRQIDAITLFGLKITASHTDQGWRIGDFDPRSLLQNTSEQNPWDIGVFDIPKAHVQIRHQMGQIQAQLGLLRKSDGNTRFEISNLSGSGFIGGQKLALTDTKITGEMTDQNVQFSTKGRLRSPGNTGLGKWEAAGTWQKTNQQNWRGDLDVQLALTAVQYAQISSKSATLQTTLHSAFSVADLLNSLEVSGQTSAAITGLNIQKIARMSFLDHLTLADDVRPFYEMFTKKIQAATSDIDINLATNFQFKKQQLQIATKQQAKLEITAKTAAATLLLTHGKWDLATNTAALHGTLHSELSGFSSLNIDGFHFETSNSSLENTRFQTDKFRMQARAGTRFVLVHGENIHANGQDGTIRGEQFTAKWDGEMAGLNLRDTTFTGALRAKISAGETAVFLDKGANITVSQLLVGQWRAKEIATKLTPTDKPAFVMTPGGFHLSFGVETAHGILAKAELDDFSVQIKGEKGLAEIDFAQNGHGLADLRMDQLSMRVFGVDEKHLQLTNSAISAQRVGGSWRGELQSGTASFQGDLLPMRAVSNAPKMQFTLNEQGLIARAKDIRLLIQAADPAFELPPLLLIADIEVKDGHITGNGRSMLQQSLLPLGTLSFTHDLALGIGHFSAENPFLAFGPYDIQPSDLLPSLTGLLANVQGALDYQFDGEWDENGLTRTGGRIDLDGFDFDMMLGRVEGISGKIELSSLLPLRTKQAAHFKIGVIDPGIALIGGEVIFSLERDEYIHIQQATWPFSGGTMRLAPMQWKIGGDSGKATLLVDNIDLLELSGLIGFDDISAEGKMSGQVPIRIAEHTMFIEHARLSAATPGIFSYTGDVGQSAGQAAPQAKMAFDLLKDLHFSQLELTLNGDVAGRIEAGIVFQGNNPEVVYGVPFLLRVNTSAELARLISQATQSMDINNNLGKIVRETQKNKEK